MDLQTLPAPIALQQLGTHLRGIPSGQMRSNYLLEKLGQAPDPWVARLLGCAQRESARGESLAQEVLEAFTHIVREELLDFESREELIQAAEQIGELPVVAMLRDADSVLSLDPRKEKEMSRGSLASEETLGRRKALARTSSGTVLDKLLRDPEPVVIEIALKNPRLKEPLVIRLAARRPVNPDVLDVISKSRFAKSPDVRRALVLNPYCRPALAAQFVPTLLRQDLIDVARDEHLDIAVRSAARHLLEQKL